MNKMYKLILAGIGHQALTLNFWLIVCGSWAIYGGKKIGKLLYSILIFPYTFVENNMIKFNSLTYSYIQEMIQNIIWYILQKRYYSIFFSFN